MPLDRLHSAFGCEPTSKILPPRIARQPGCKVDFMLAFSLRDKKIGASHTPYNRWIGSPIVSDRGL